MPAFEIVGVANFASIPNELQKLNNTLASFRAPAIKIQEPNFGNFFAAIDKAEAKTIKIKTQIETPNTVSSGFTNFLNSEKGKFANVGREMGQSLQMGMTQQFGMAGGVASSFATALGPMGIVAGVAGAALIGLGAASTQAAMKWEDMKTSIGRTTGLKGDNLEDLMNQLQGLRQEFGVTAEAASSMVEQAGSIGVGQKKMETGDLAGYKQEILDFTQATAILQGAWGMSAEATSSGIGKMGSVTLGQWNIQRKARGEEEMSWADYAYKVGGTVDNLANAMGSSEEEIVTAMRNSSGAIAKWAPSEDTYGKWQAMASFLIDTGSSAGEAGTQIERVAQKLDQNSADVAKVMGIDQATLSSNLKADFMGTVQSLGEAIASMPASARPDTAKMFGLEGKVLIDKVVADIEAGTGKLQSAYDLALKPGNVKQGYEDVADNASKAFDRIGQAFQVSLEKIGGQLLPIVSDVANGIADAWISANEIGTEAFTTVQSRVASADKTIAETGSIVEWGKALLGIGDEAEPIIKDAMESGAEAGTADGIKKGTKSAASDAGKVLAEEFTKAQDEYIKSHSSGGYSNELMAMLATNGSVDTGARYLYGIQNTKLDQTNYALLQNYTLNRSARSTDKSGILQILDSSGSIIKAESYTSDAEFKKLSKSLRDSIKPAFLDMPKYMASVKNDMSSAFEGILSDGVVEFTEKDQIREYLKSLDALRVEYPIEFDSSGLLKIRGEAEKAFLGIPITFDKEELETNFALWQRDNMDMYQTIYDTLSPKYGMFSPQAVPTEPDERKLHDALVSADNERLSYLYDQINKAVTSGDFADAEVLPEVLAEIATIEPDILNMKGTTQRLDAIQAMYGKQVISTGDSFRVLDTNGQALGSSHLRTSVAAELASGGLLKVRDDAYAAASALASVGGIRFSGSPSMASQGDYNWVRSRMYDSDKNNAFAGNFQGMFPGNKSLNFGSAVSTADFGGLLSTFNIPKLGQVSKVSAKSGGTLAWVGERGEDEWVIPESEIKGLYPKSANIDKGSFNYLSNYRYFEDYPEPEIRPPTAYRWSHYPDAPQVQELNTEAIQTAWLADEQLNSRDVYSGRIRQAQIDAIGKHSVIPWFARGMQDQPDWWVDAATKLSPQYASTWAAQKGGVVPKVIEDVTTSNSVKPNPLLTGTTAWATIYDDSGTCIGFNKPDPSANIHLTPRKVSFDAAAWAGVYDDSGTCIAFVKPDKNLNFQPGAGYEVGGSRVSGSITSTEVSKSLASIEKNTAKSAEKTELTATYSSQMVDAIRSPIKGFDNGNPFGKLSLSSMPGDALVTGLSQDGYVVTYDPRTDTCEGLAFNPPDPSLKTTDKFYLGINAGNLPFESYDDGYGWGGKVAWTDNPELAKIQQGVMQSYKEQQKTAKDTAKIEQNTKDMAQGLGVAGGNVSGGILGALVSAFGGGGSGALNSRGSFGGSYGSMFGGWYGGGASGLSAHLGTASSASWMNAAATSIGGAGAIQWAEGGITDRPTYGVFGEAGREAFVPISDRAAGLKILPQVMRELGVRTFAVGGIVGGGVSAIMESVGSTTIAPVYNINGSGLSESQLMAVMERNNKKLLAQVAKKDVLAVRRRG